MPSGSGCHGDAPRAVFDELCQVVEETIEVYRQDGKPLPKPMTGRQIVTAMQSVA
jgi:predicted RNase H-like HicB family nuclease